MMNNQISQNEMKPKNGNLFKAFDALKKGDVKTTTKFSEDQIEQTLSSFTNAGPTYQYIYNNATDRFVFLSENVNNMLGVNPESFTPSAHSNLIHPDDLAHVKHCRDIANYFLVSHVDKPAIADYKVSYQFRMKDKFGKYKVMLHQSIPLSLNDKGQPVNVLVNETDISHITTTNNYKVSFLAISDKKSYLNIRNKEDLMNPLPSAKIITERELDILRLLSEGFSSKEIAGNLHIAYDTVRTHRNNILKKTKLKTLAQVISHYIKEGLI